MCALLLREPQPVRQRPLVPTTLEVPELADDELLIAVSACGVCRTDLHVVTGELPPATLPIVPGHEVVGRVVAVGRQAGSWKSGDRVGVAWVYRFCGTCEYCLTARENLCRSPTFTGYHRHGGFAEYIVAHSAFVHPLPDALGDDLHVAPLLCAGIIGYRALKRSRLVPGARLALYGFGAAAHIALQIAKAWGCEVFVFSRGEASRERARRLGADWVGAADDTLPRPVDHAVSFAPAGSVIPAALAGLAPGGTLAIAGIYVDRVPALDYGRHLFAERNLVSVTANTRADAREFLHLASRLSVRTDIAVFELAQANEALLGLAEDHLPAQAAVLRVPTAPTQL